MKHRFNAPKISVGLSLALSPGRMFHATYLCWSQEVNMYSGRLRQWLIPILILFDLSKCSSGRSTYWEYFQPLPLAWIRRLHVLQGSGYRSSVTSLHCMWILPTAIPVSLWFSEHQWFWEIARRLNHQVTQPSLKTWLSSSAKLSGSTFYLQAANRGDASRLDWSSRPRKQR